VIADDGVEDGTFGRARPVGRGIHGGRRSQARAVDGTASARVSAAGALGRNSELPAP